MCEQRRRKAVKMTELKCKHCEKTFRESEIFQCANCNSNVCEDCKDDEEEDVRDCNCAYLCETCRQGPSTCKGCNDGLCALCGGNGCDICLHDKEHENDLICDDCTRDCEVCDRAVCTEHVVAIKAKIGTDQSVTEKHFCTDCVKKGVQLLLKQKTDADVDSATNESKKRKIVYDQTLDVDAE